MSSSTFSSYILKMATTVRSSVSSPPLSQETNISTKTPDDSMGGSTPISTLAGSVSDKGYYGDEEPSSLGSEAPRDPELGIQYTEEHNNKNSVFRNASSLTTGPKLVFGLFIVIIIATSWVLSTQLAKSTYTGNFKAPFFLVWFGTSWMILLYPVTIPFYFVLVCKLPTWSAFKELWNHSKEVISPPNSTPISFLTSTILFSLLWIPTNYLYARALISLPPTDVTALFSTAPAFVFIFSMILLREPPLILRFLAVIFAVGGIVLFSYEDGFGSANTVGVLLSVGSAIGAALYKTLLKWRVKEASLFQMSLFLSSIGAFCAAVFWPLLIILHATGVEVIHDVHWGIVCGHAIVGIIFNFAINFGIAYTFPLFISLGTILGIPISGIVDVLLRHINLANWKITAIDFIVGGFLLILVPPDSSEWLQNKVYHAIKCTCCKIHCKNR